MVTEGPTQTRREAEVHAETVSLYEHTSRQIEGLKELFDAKLDAQQTALTVALAAVNESLKSVTEKLRTLELTEAKLSGKADQKAVWLAYVMALASMGLAVLGLWVKAR